jgi:hypothetical protein
MRAQNIPNDRATFHRRRAVLAAAVLSFIGVVALAVRESAARAGRTGTVAMLTIGLIVYVAPFAAIVDRAMRRRTIPMAAVAVVGATGAIFLATRSVGSFSQLWLAFTMVVSFLALRATGELASRQSTRGTTSRSEGLPRARRKRS